MPKKAIRLFWYFRIQDIGLAMGKFSFLRVLELPKLLGDNAPQRLGIKLNIGAERKSSVRGVRPEKKAVPTAHLEGSETREKSGPNGSSGELKFPKAT
jgi:hypothetical protein